MSTEQDPYTEDLNICLEKININNINIWKPGMFAGSIEIIEAKLGDTMNRSYTAEDIKKILESLKDL